GAALADPAQGLGGGAGVVRRLARQQLDQGRQRLGVAPQADGVQRRLPDALVGVGQGGAHGGAGVGVVDPRRGPDGVGAGLHRLAGADHVGQRGQAGGAFAGQGVDGAGAHGRAGVVQQPGEVLGVQFGPGDLEAAGVGDGGGALPADAVDGAQHVGLVQLRGGAAQLVPAAGVDHQQAAVGVLDHVGGVEVKAVADQEVLVPAGEGGAVGGGDVAGNLAQGELGGEHG